MRSSSWREVVAQQINWRHQLCNGRGGSDKDNGDANDNKDMETTIRTITTMVVESIGIDAGMDGAAVLHQGLMTQGKRS
jgi:hypothetical protein